MTVQDHNNFTTGSFDTLDPATNQTFSLFIANDDDFLNLWQITANSWIFIIVINEYDLLDQMFGTFFQNGHLKEYWKFAMLWYVVLKSELTMVLSNVDLGSFLNVMTTLTSGKSAPLAFSCQSTSRHLSCLKNNSYQLKEQEWILPKTFYL